MRLDKYLSLAQIGTRKKVKEYIYQGEVSVDGTTIQTPAYEVDSQKDHVCYKNNPVTDIRQVCYMFYKPQGCITAKCDELHRTVFDYFRDLDTTGLFPVGRLDMDTEGLLLITNDGDLSNRLMAPEHHVEKTYYFWVFGKLSEEAVSRIEAGMEIDSGVCTSPARIQILKSGTYFEFEEELRRDGCEVVKKNLHRHLVTSGFLTIKEGMKHQVKRMMKAVGCHVIYLKRVSIGNLQLDEHMEKGSYRLLRDEELACFYG